MKDIGPNRHLNKILGACIGLIAALPFYFGVHSLTFLRPEDRGFSIVALVIAFAILAVAIWVGSRPPINAARLRFHAGGFRLETRQVLRGERSYNLNWAEITEILHTNAGLYGGRSIRIVTREGARPAWFAAAWTDTGGLEIISRLSASAEADGFSLEKEAGFWRGMVQDRWTVRKAP